MQIQLVHKLFEVVLGTKPIRRIYISGIVCDVAQDDGLNERRKTLPHLGKQKNKKESVFEEQILGHVL